MDILKLLDDSPVVAGYEVLEFKQWSVGVYYKIKVQIRGGSVLFVREYLDEAKRNYSFHWQNESGSLMIRWDNAPHHVHLITYPHHKHIGDELAESREIQLIDVLYYIRQQLEVD